MITGKRIFTIALCLLAIKANAVPADTIRHHWGAELSIMPGRAIVMDEWQSKWQKDRQNLSFDLKLIHATLPSDSNDYARDYPLLLRTIRPSPAPHTPMGNRLCTQFRRGLEPT